MKTQLNFPEYVRNIEPDLVLMEHFGDFMAFIVPCFIFIEFRLEGRLFLPEVLLVAVLLFYMLTRKIRLEDRARRILVLGGAWLLWQIMTDLIRETPFEDFARGWAKIGAFLLLFLAMQSLLKDRARRIWLFAFGHACGGILQYYLNPTELAIGEGPDNYWKFGLGPPLTILSICFLSLPLFRKHVWKIIAALLALTLLHWLMGYRSMGAFVWAVAILRLWQEWHVRAKAERSINLLPIVAASIFLFIGAPLLYEFAGRNVEAEYKKKYAGQSGVLGPIIGGRAEILASSRAIADSPIIGHGSWAKNPQYIDYLLGIVDYGYVMPYIQEGSNLIPTHSHFFGAWVEAGLMGALFWAYCWVVALRAIFQACRLELPQSLLVFFFGVSLLWAILFSPFGAEQRLYEAFSLTLMLAVLDAGDIAQALELGPAGEKMLVPGLCARLPRPTHTRPGPA